MSNEPSLEYLAGAADAGCFIRLRHHGRVDCPVFRIGGKKPLLEQFAARFGGEVRRVATRPNWYWECQGVRFIEVMSQLRPFMVARAEDVDECLAWRPQRKKKAERVRTWLDQQRVLARMAQ